VAESTAPPVSNARCWAKQQSAQTRRSLILAAMRLMAADGIDGVSMRAINVAAGAGNSSAAHYHFGNKLGLIEAIVDTLAGDVAAVRAPLMAQLRQRAKSQPVSVREIVDAAYLPFMGLLFHSDYGLPGIKFLSRLIVDTSDEMRPVANRLTGPMANEVFELLGQALPEVPEDALKLRILFSLTNLINGMADVTALESSPFGDVSTPGSLEAAEQFMRYIVAGLSAPAQDQLDPRFVKTARELIAIYSAAGNAAEEDNGTK